ncbi:Cleavage and polyadenylation specificity factor subunit 1 [Temnothorax longispinosus]|uniref:Cleavage and polyadenylation specificity factor subunit 1 n=1 Tax=Temnothorax longispinosus TaxID=300112 RepID=A0A4S2KJZ2_9HYME|nr:Cleavage and polyadenylation specificity factor subunit 1 [Temnothorax longispinosus]
MYSICKSTHPATGVEHAITCHFFNRTEKCLVVAGADVIRVFRLIPDVDMTRREKYTEMRPPKMKLECLAQYTLHGNIMSMQAVHLIGSQRDSLLLSFRDAKLSVVEYDQDIHDLRTVSLHYFEEEEIKDGWTNHHHIPIVRVDPEGRCAVMLIFGRKLVVLPFRKDPSLDDGDLLDTAKLSSSNKTPILSSYMIVLKTLEEKMDNVIDLQFLHGYYEPTLLILYEPVRTFSGRIAVRQDTCAMVAISLNIQQRVHPIIWSVSNLPFDCYQAVPVKKPLGGTLIMAVNSLIYLNQSIPPYGVSLNSLADTSTNFPLKPQEGVKMSLEGAQVAFISADRLVISLKSGELYVLSLFADSMRSVRGFHFDKAAASVLTSCVCMCEDNYLFLGSRLGNSLLLRFTEKEPETLKNLNGGEITIEENESEETPAKKAKQDFLGDWMASDVLDIKDPEELEVYGSETHTSIQITSYIFEVCDSLLNIGPCGNISMGEPAFLSEEFLQNQDPDVELVTTSGYGKNGALCVLQRSIRPQVVTTFELPGCEDMWTVIGTLNNDEIKTEAEGSHAFLILSQEDSTMILQTGQEINEVDQSGFSTQGSTVFAGNLGANRYIVQVTQMGVRLLQGIEQIQHMPIDLGCPIVHASCADPYVALLSEDGQVMLLTLREVRGTARLHAQTANLLFRPQIEALCAYRDVSGIFTTQLLENADDEQTEEEYNVEEPSVLSNIDNEDDLLYGDAPAFQMPAPSYPKASDGTAKKLPWWQRHLQEIKSTYWLLVYRDSGTLEIYSLPDLRLSYLIRNFGFGQYVLHDSMESTTLQSTPLNEIPHPDMQVREILMVALGHHGSRPMLLVRLDSELQIYQAYRYPKGYLKLRFKKLDHGIIPGRLRFDPRPKEEDIPRNTSDSRICVMRYFSNIAGYNGVFICSDYPHWIFLTGRGELRTHPMGIDGSVTSFAAFNNINCPQGFLYFNRKEELRICVLPTHLSYDAPWPVRKVPLRCTPHFVTYHLESKTYCVITSTAEPLKSYYRFNGEDKEFTEEERPERFLYPSQEQFSIVLFSPVSWETIPNTKIELDQWEHVTCLKNVSLAYEGTRSGLKGYIVLGTNYNYGEDITSRGRILIFDIIEVVPEPGQPLTKNRFKQIYAKEQKGPITAITQVSGFLVSAVGQKIYIWQLKDNDLVGVAFIDTQIYIHQMLSIKSLILIADVYKSISLLRFQEEYRTLSLVSRDFRPAEVYTIEYLIDNTNLGFVVADGESNLALFMYQPESRESLGGQKLIRKADFHLGQKVNTFFRIRCRVTDPANDKKQFSGADKRHVTMYVPIEPSLLERRLCEAFDVFDNARSGEVDVRDLGTIIRALGCVITEAELQEIQVEVEDVENNCVPLNRFVEYMSKAINERKFKPAEPEELLKAFQLLDPENRGYIMKDDLEKSIMEIGEPFTKEEVADMMAVACDAETGKINYEHYINLLIVKIPENINVYNIVDEMETAKLAELPKRRRWESILFKEDIT